MVGFAVVMIVLLGCCAIGAWFRRSNGRMQPVPGVADEVDAVGVHEASSGEHGGEVLTSDALGHPLGERATLVQFSSAFCQPCRATKLILDDLSRTIPGVSHLEIDAESHMALVRDLDVRRTPTILLLDSKGVIRQRAVGQPRKSDVVAAVAAVV